MNPVIPIGPDDPDHLLHAQSDIGGVFSLRPEYSLWVSLDLDLVSWFGLELGLGELQSPREVERDSQRWLEISQNGP